MKKTTLLPLLMLISILTHAQFKQIAEGTLFSEPEEGFAKIIQMKNGNTFYMNISLKNGINVRIYDASHKQTVMNTISPGYQELKTADIEAAFEQNNDIVVFISERDDRTPVLYRVVIDGNTGKLKDDKTIARMKKEGAFINTSAYNSFSVSKDPYSDNYGVCLYHVMEGEKDKRIEIIHYGKDNNEISRTFCASPDPEYGFFLYVDMVVMGPEKVKAILFASKEKYELGRKGTLYVATIERDKAISYSKLDFAEDILVAYGLARFNPVTKNILLLTAAKAFDDKYIPFLINDKFIPYLVIIDPQSNSVKKAFNPKLEERLHASYKEAYDTKNNYTGMPQNLFINDDGSFTIIYETMMVQKQSGTGMGFGTSSTQIRVDTRLGKMAIASYDKEGALTSNYIVPKIHWIIFQELSPFYHARREGSAQQLFRGNQYKSFAYLNGVNKNYILFNDTERNNEVKKNKFVEVEGISDCDAFMYKLTGNEIFPKREYTFGAPASKAHTLALYSISDYDKKNNMYVTLKLDKETRTSKDVKLVWLQPQ